MRLIWTALVVVAVLAAGAPTAAPARPAGQPTAAAPGAVAQIAQSAARFRALTLSITPNPSVAGQPVALTGRLTGSGVGGRRVVLWHRLTGERRFRPVRAVYTTPQGRYTLTRGAGQTIHNGSWYAQAVGRRSPVVAQRVQAVMTLADDNPVQQPGQPVRFSITVAPRHAGERVLLQQVLGPNAVRTIASVRLDGASRATTIQRFTAQSAMRIRAQLPGGRRNARSTTPSVLVTIGYGIHQIKHIVVIMQENRSFDSYFGTYPGADGIPPGACAVDPATGQCVAPYHDTNDRNTGGPHGAAAAVADVNGGKMDGFIGQAEQGRRCTTNDPSCSVCTTPGATACLDVMGYHNANEVPNYWQYARNYVLQDHMFEANASWSLPQRLYMVSEWSARCARTGDPSSCANALQSPALTPDVAPAGSRPPDYPWTDMTYLLHAAGVSWGYYVFAGGEPDCANDQSVTCSAPGQNAKTPGIWNPLPYFDTVRQNKQLGNIQSLKNFYVAAENGSLPAVSWINPNNKVSEHPPALVSAGQTYTTSLINAIMNGPNWNSTAILLSWDDWGGFYDHAVPPTVDQNGYGLRVPGMVISPYAKTGAIDHQVLSHDAYNKLIQDDFLAGQRLDPARDGRPDPRPTVRENVSGLGDITNDFDFSQQPRPPMLLPAHPPPGM